MARWPSPSFVAGSHRCDARPMASWRRRRGEHVAMPPPHSAAREGDFGPPAGVPPPGAVANSTAPQRIRGTGAGLSVYASEPRRAIVHLSSSRSRIPQTDSHVMVSESSSSFTARAASILALLVLPAVLAAQAGTGTLAGRVTAGERARLRCGGHRHRDRSWHPDALGRHAIASPFPPGATRSARG